jgi:CRISPR/Cas system CMR-associated protein Cmr5 small subunit
MSNGNNGLDATALGSVNVTGTCARDSTWNGSICAAPAPAAPTPTCPASYTEVYGNCVKLGGDCTGYFRKADGTYITVDKIRAPGLVYIAQAIAANKATTIIGDAVPLTAGVCMQDKGNAGGFSWSYVPVVSGTTNAVPFYCSQYSATTNGAMTQTGGATPCPPADPTPTPAPTAGNVIDCPVTPIKDEGTIYFTCGTASTRLDGTRQVVNACPAGYYPRLARPDMPSTVKCIANGMCSGGTAGYCGVVSVVVNGRCEPYFGEDGKNSADCTDTNAYSNSKACDGYLKKVQTSNQVSYRCLPLDSSVSTIYNMGGPYAACPAAYGTTWSSACDIDPATISNGGRCKTGTDYCINSNICPSTHELNTSGACVIKCLAGEFRMPNGVCGTNATFCPLVANHTFDDFSPTRCPGSVPVTCTANQYSSGGTCVNFTCGDDFSPLPQALINWRAVNCATTPVACTNGNAAQNGTPGASSANRYVQLTGGGACPASAPLCTSAQAVGNICPTLGTSCRTASDNILSCVSTTCGDTGVRTNLQTCPLTTPNIIGTGGPTWINEYRTIKFTPSVAGTCGVYGSNGTGIDTSIVIRGASALPAGNEQTVAVQPQYLSSVGAKGFYVQCTPASGPVFTSGVITINVYALPTATITDAKSTLSNYGTVKTESTCMNSSTSTIEYNDTATGAGTPVTGYSNFTIPTQASWTVQTPISDQLNSNYPGKNITGKPRLYVNLTCKSSAGGSEKVATGSISYSTVLVKAVKDVDGDLSTDDRVSIKLPTGYYASTTLYTTTVNSSITSSSSSLFWALPIGTEYKAMIDNMPLNYQFLGIATSSSATAGIFPTLDAMPTSTVSAFNSITVFYAEKLPTAAIVMKKINCPFDIDGDGYITENDALLFTRVGLGISSTAITNSVTFANGATRTTGVDIASFINSQPVGTYDFDGDGSVLPLKDGVIFTRYVRGFQSGLTTGVLSTGSTRTTFDAIDSYILSKCADGNALLHSCRNSTGYIIVGTKTSGSGPLSKIVDQGYSQEFVDAVSAHSGETVNSSNSQYDLNDSGAINSSDVAIARGAINLTSPTPKDFSTTTDPYETGLKYALTCYGAQDTDPAIATLETYAPIVITATNSPMTKTMQDVPLSWTSTAKTCGVYDFDGATKIGSVITGRGAKIGETTTVPPSPIYSPTGPYDFSFTLSTTSPMYRTELNSSHLDINTPPNSLGYKIKCFDTSRPARGTTTSPIKVQVYKTTVANISGPDTTGKIDLRCTSDYDYMNIIRSDDVAVTGYPKTYPNNQIVNSTVSISPVSGVVYTLICKSVTIPENVSQDVYPKSGLLLYGNISGDITQGQGNTAADDEVYVYATSSVGKFTGLSYTVTGADTWTVVKRVRTGDDVYTNVNTNGTGNTTVSLSATDSGYYPYGAEWIITGVKGVVTKKLHLVLGTQFSPTAQIVSVTPIASAAPTINTYAVAIRCQNSTSYELQNITSGATTVAIDSGSATVSDFTKTVNSALTPPTATSWQVKLICKAGTDTDEKVATVVNPLMAPARFIRFSTNPNSLVCGGGNVSLSWDVQYAKSKNCVITATTTTDLLSTDSLYAQKKASIDAANLYLTGNHASFTDGLSVTNNLTQSDALESQDSQLHSVGEFTRIPVKYGTRFIMTCNSGRQKADVEVACTGQQ